MNPVSLLLLALVAFGLWLYYRRLPAGQRGRFLMALAVAALLFGIIYLALTQRLYLLGALVAMTLPFMRRLLPLLLRGLPFLVAWRRRRQQQGATRSGNRSTVASEILEMELDHDTGVMYGAVLRGPMEGRDLADLENKEFIELLQYCRQQDTESARLLETYLDKRFGDRWHADDPDGARDDAEPRAHSGEMSDAEAYEILGLEPGAERDAIVQAHRRLMQKLHPDRGGSPYLASRINAARSRLLGE